MATYNKSYTWVTNKMARMLMYFFLKHCIDIQLLYAFAMYTYFFLYVCNLYAFLSDSTYYWTVTFIGLENTAIVAWILTGKLS